MPSGNTGFAYSPNASQQDISQTAQYHLLYTRFLSVAPKIHPLLRQLESRAAVYPQDLSSLLSECSTAYFTARRSLLAGWIQEEMKTLDVVRGELVELVSSFKYRSGWNHDPHDAFIDKSWLWLPQTTVH